jgi:hypothetical protein
LSAQQIVKRSKAAVKATVSVRVRGTLMTDDGRPLTLDVSVTRIAGSGVVSIDGAGFKLVVIGRTAYLQASDAFWRRYTKPKKQADPIIQVMRGKWLKVAMTNKNFGELATFATKRASFDTMFDDAGSLRKTGTKTVGDNLCVGLTDPPLRGHSVDRYHQRPPHPHGSAGQVRKHDLQRVQPDQGAHGAAGRPGDRRQDPRHVRVSRPAP